MSKIGRKKLTVQDVFERFMSGVLLDGGDAGTLSIRGDSLWTKRYDPDTEREDDGFCEIARWTKTELGEQVLLIRYDAYLLGSYKPGRSLVRMQIAAVLMGCMTRSILMRWGVEYPLRHLDRSLMEFHNGRHKITGEPLTHRE
jgi:hypothetical protein